VILWKDFVLDDEAGPLLVSQETTAPMMVSRNHICREKRFGSPSVKEDAIGTNGTLANNGVLIQETRREQRPARMVGLTDLEFAQAGKEASRSNRTVNSLQRGEG